MDTIGGTPGKTGALVANDWLILLVFVAAVVGVLIAGIVIGLKLRGRRRRERERQIRGEHLPGHRSSGSSSSSSGGATDESSSSGGESSGRRRVRRRRRDHRPRNPSLAEAGGLPPERDPDAPQPGAESN